MNDPLPSDPTVLFMLAVQAIHYNNPDAASRLRALTALLANISISTSPATCGELCKQTIDLYTTPDKGNNHAQPIHA